MRVFEYFLLNLEDVYAYFLFFRSTDGIDTSYKVVSPFLLDFEIITLKLSLFLTFYFIIFKFIGIGLWLFSVGEKFENAIRKAFNSSIKGFIKFFIYAWMGITLLSIVFNILNFQISTSNSNVLYKASLLKQKFELSQLEEKMNKLCTRCNGDGQVDQADIIRLNKENEWKPGKCNQCQGN